MSCFYVKGFFELIPQDLIKIFDENELEVSFWYLALKCCNFQIHSKKVNNDAFLSSTAAHVWSWRCGCEWLESEYEVQEWLLLQPHRYPVVLESKMSPQVLLSYKKCFVLGFIFFAFVFVCFVIDSAVDGCRKANPAPAVCDRNIKGPNEWLCWTLWWDNLHCTAF